jgi:hypothetical protein
VNRLLYLHAAAQHPHAVAVQEIWKYTISSELPATTAALYLQLRCQAIFSRGRNGGKGGVLVRGARFVRRYES